MRSPQSAESLTASEPIATALEDGSVVEGTLGFHPSGKGRFKVSYAGKSKMETRSYMGVEYMRSGALRECKAPLPSRLTAKAAQRKTEAERKRRLLDCAIAVRRLSGTTGASA